MTPNHTHTTEDEMAQMVWYICLSERPDCRYVYSVSHDGKVGNRQHIRLAKLTQWIVEQRKYGRIVVDLVISKPHTKENKR